MILLNIICHTNKILIRKYVRFICNCVLKCFEKEKLEMTGKTHASCGALTGALTTQYFHTDLFTQSLYWYYQL